MRINVLDSNDKILTTVDSVPEAIEYAQNLMGVVYIPTVEDCEYRLAYGNHAPLFIENPDTRESMKKRLKLENADKPVLSGFANKLHQPMTRTLEELLARVKVLPCTTDNAAWNEPNFDNPWPEVVALMADVASHITPGFSDLSEIANDFLGGLGLSDRQVFVDEVSERYQVSDADCGELFSLWAEYKQFCNYI